MFFKKKDKVNRVRENGNPNAKEEIFLPITLELAEVSQGIYKSSGELEEYSNTLKEAADEVSANITFNKENVGKVQVEMGRISKAAEEINERAMDNKELSQENLKHVQSNMADLRESVGKIEDLFLYFGEMSKTLEKLQGYSEGIANVTNYIDEIAAKTSLVSLNASIEAARAGEAGRGFMVITDEIKKLANQSKEFSDSISGMISNMTSCIYELNKASQENCEKINETKKTISMMGNNLNRMVESSSKLDENILSTLESSRVIKQSVQIGEQKVDELNDSFKGTIKCTEEMNKAVSLQNQAVNQLGEMNEKVRLISEKQLNIVLSDSIKEKLELLGKKIAAYSGKHETETLKVLAKKYYMSNIYYINKDGFFIEGTDNEAMGLNIFEINKEYKKFAESNQEVEVFELARNLCTGGIFRYMGAKDSKDHQFISVAFDLESMAKINKLSLEELEAL